MELLGSRVCICSTSVDTPRTFPKCPHSLLAPSSVGCPSCSTASPALGIFHHFHFRHSSECAPVPHSHLPDDQQSWTVLSVYETHERGYSIHSFVTCLLKSLSMFVTFSFSCCCAGVLCTCASPLSTCMLPITISDMEHHVMTFEEFFFQFFFSFMAMMWGLQDLSSPARDWTQAPAMGVPSPKHWKDQPGNSRNFSEGAPSGGCQTRGLVTIESHSRSRDRGSRHQRCSLSPERAGAGRQGGPASTLLSPADASMGWSTGEWVRKPRGSEFRPWGHREREEGCVSGWGDGTQRKWTY